MLQTALALQALALALPTLALFLPTAPGDEGSNPGADPQQGCGGCKGTFSVDSTTAAPGITLEIKVPTVVDGDPYDPDGACKVTPPSTCEESAPCPIAYEITVAFTARNYVEHFVWSEGPPPGWTSLGKVYFDSYSSTTICDCTTACGGDSSGRTDVGGASVEFSYACTECTWITP